MLSEDYGNEIIVFDIGGTWFRWGIHARAKGLIEAHRSPAINYLTNPTAKPQELQSALVNFILERVDQIHAGRHSAPNTVSISLGAPINAHDMTVFGSGPLWGPTALPIDLSTQLRQARSEVEWFVVNDVTAMLAPYMEEAIDCNKTMLITVSSGIGSRLYDHRAHRIPYDSVYGIQGEIGHLACAFELDGLSIRRQCECGGWNHMNAFSSGRGIASILQSLPAMSSTYSSMFVDSPAAWQETKDEYRLNEFMQALEHDNPAALKLLQAFVTPLSRALATALSMDPDIDRIIMTGGVVQGLGQHYRKALKEVFVREGLYQITPRDPQYLDRRLIWAEADDFSGLKGAGIYATRPIGSPPPQRTRASTHHMAELS